MNDNKLSPNQLKALKILQEQCDGGSGFVGKKRFHAHLQSSGIPWPKTVMNELINFSLVDDRRGGGRAPDYYRISDLGAGELARY